MFHQLSKRNSSNFVKKYFFCASYFQLSSCCLDIPMKHCLSCLICYFNLSFNTLLIRILQFARVFLQVTIVSQTFKLHYPVVKMGLTWILTCESNNLFAFRTLSRLPFKRLLDPGGKCMYMSDLQGSISRARRQQQTIMALMSCSKRNQEQIVNAQKGSCHFKKMPHWNWFFVLYFGP